MKKDSTLITNRQVQCDGEANVIADIPTQEGRFVRHKVCLYHACKIATVKLVAKLKLETQAKKKEQVIWTPET